ncbi:hypothetical protein DPMN_086115 [Dreissena polymorpha]|uniref:Uncharacterized protein n=1 Tax=Dreissena polymorpha TaxID=45954 RepID=A0A9D4BKW8_DREPO|nr:hypothetical protein DPMN_086115 [Dreissena polymorpha]
MVAVSSPWTSCGRRSNPQKMIIDCKATLRRPYCDISTCFVRLWRPQNDCGRNKNAKDAAQTPYGRLWSP